MTEPQADHTDSKSCPKKTTKTTTKTKKKNTTKKATSSASSASGRKYSLVVNAEQARVIREALEIYSRLKHGQISELRNLFMDRWCEPNGSFNWSSEYLFDELKRVIFPDLDKNASYGVGNKVYPESSVAWDVMQVLRHRLAWDRLKDEGKDKPEHWGVHYNEPMRFGSEPLAHIEAVP